MEALLLLPRPVGSFARLLPHPFFLLFPLAPPSFSTSQPLWFLPPLATFHDLARLGPEHCGSGRRHFGTETGCGGGKSGKRGLFKVPKTSSRDRAQRHPQARGTSGGAEGNTVPWAPYRSPGDQRVPVSALGLEGSGAALVARGVRLRAAGGRREARGARPRR